VGNGHEASWSTGGGQAGLGEAKSEEAKCSEFGRYRIIGELGRGGMGIVYRAFEPVLRREVALKTLPKADPALLSRFKREFRVLAALDHPNVGRLFELISDGESWFFTMELVDGVDLLHYVRYGSRQPKAETSDRAIEDSDVTLQRTQELNPSAQIQRARDVAINYLEGTLNLNSTMVCAAKGKNGGSLCTAAHRWRALLVTAAAGEG